MDKLLFCTSFREQMGSEGFSGSSGVYLAVASIGAPGSPSVIVYSMYTTERTGICCWMQGWTISLGVEIYSFKTMLWETEWQIMSGWCIGRTGMDWNGYHERIGAFFFYSGMSLL